MISVQPDIPGLLPDEGGTDRPETPCAARKARLLPAERLAPLLNAALTAENITFPTYSLLVAARRETRAGAGIRLGRLADLTGLSYYATRQQVVRTPWWAVRHGLGTVESCITVSLLPEALTKLSRISARLSKA
jgi:hypothetical protein